MSNVTKPIALDETFNTTEVTPRNTADVLAQELSAIATAIGNQQSAGHIVENPSGGIMPQRDGLQFVDSHLNDDSANNRTQVETLKPVTSATFETETEDGFYYLMDATDEPLRYIKSGVKLKPVNLFPASRTTYDNTSSGLSANRVQGAIDEVSTNVSGKVSKSGDTMSGTLTLGSGGSRGELDIKSSGGTYTTRIYNSTSTPLTANRVLYLPDASGTIAIEPTEQSGDLKGYVQSGFIAGDYQLTYVKQGHTVTICVNGVVAANTGDAQIMAILPNELKGKIQTFSQVTGSRGAVQGLAYISGRNLVVNLTTASAMYFSIVYQV